MITLTQLKGEAIVLNAELIESLEAMPDTIITLSSGKRVIVKEPVSEVAHKVEAYFRRSRMDAPDWTRDKEVSWKA